MKLSPYPYQEAGIASAISRFRDGDGVLLADDMGLGKTCQAIGVIDYMPQITSVLIVCPASVKRNWERELHTWMERKLTVGVQRGLNFPDTNIVILNFEALKQFRYLIRRQTFDLLIVDEAHYLKNSSGRASEVMGKNWGTEFIAPIPARYKLFLTGSPMPSRPIEIYSLVNFLSPGTFGTRKEFDTKYGQGENLNELQTRLRRSIMIRRLKKDVLAELPAKIRQVIELPTGQAGAAVKAELATFERLQGLQAQIKARQTSGANPDEPEYQAAVLALREAEKVAFCEMAKRRHETAVAKIPAAIAFLDDTCEQSKKVIAFCHHHEVVAALKKHFGARCVVIDGGTSQEARQKIVDRFQNDPTIELFIGSAAAREGLTLTASSHVVMVELDYVPGNVSQAEDRAHRIGQKNAVLVQHLVVEGSLDAKMATMIVEKQAQLDEALNSQAA